MEADEVFIMWKGLVKEIGKARYTAVERKEQLDELCEMFSKFGVDVDEAKSYKRKVIEFMVTKEGMKGNGKHKGWKEATEEDFISNLMAYYQGEYQSSDTSNLKPSKVGDVHYYGSLSYMVRTPLMVAWSKHKFKNKWTESICLETHKVGSPLWQLFDKEVINSKWAKSGERPQWCKYVF